MVLVLDVTEPERQSVQVQFCVLADAFRLTIPVTLVVYGSHGTQPNDFPLNCRETGLDGGMGERTANLLNWFSPMKTKESTPWLAARIVKKCAQEAGFELAGIASAGPVYDFERYRRWVDAGLAGKMGYLTDRRAELRSSPAKLMPSARSVLCVGKLYNGPEPDIRQTEPGQAWISRYAWGQDYHGVLREGLERTVERLREEGFEFDHKICVDTAPVLERSLAREAGLGWIGKNTCLINQQQGSWFFLGELLLSLDLEADLAPPDRCGTCTRCIDACPTAALVPGEDGWKLDARRCISYLTIELKGPMPEELREGVGRHVMGCDICQDVCPWNTRAAHTPDERFRAAHFSPQLLDLAVLTPEDFRSRFGQSPVLRARHTGLLRNVITAIGNAPRRRYCEVLQPLLLHEKEEVAEHAAWAYEKCKKADR